VHFLHFWPSKTHVSPTGIISSIFPPSCRISSYRCRHAVGPCCASFPWSQDELVVPALSSSNVSCRRLTSRADTKALNLHHYRPPSLNRSTSTIYCYKKAISTLPIFPTTQPRLYFTYSLARVTRHRSFTCRHHSLLPSSHVHPHNNTHDDKLTDHLLLLK
jgi:hypothetical protein